MAATTRSKPKRQQGRLRKLHCTSCGAILYGSAACIRECGLPQCRCGEAFEVANMRDLAVIDPDLFEERANALSDKARNQLMRELGYSDAIVSTHRGGNRTRGRRQCQHDGCRRLPRFGRHCDQHLADGLPF